MSMVFNFDFNSTKTIDSKNLLNQSQYHAFQRILGFLMKEMRRVQGGEITQST